MNDGWILILRVVLSLGIVLALLWFFARRVNGQKPNVRGAAIRLVGRQAVSRHASVAVIEVDNQRFFVGVADTQVTLLAELEPVVPSDDDVVDTEDSTGPEILIPGPAGESKQQAWDRELKQAQEQDAPLSGSILAASTWRRAWQFVQGRR